MKDKYLTINEQIKLIENQQVAQLNLNLIRDELLAMSRSDKRSVFSYVRLIVEHLIKLRCAKNPEILEKWHDHWQNEVNNFQSELSLLLEESPSLKNYLEDALRRGLQQAKNNLKKFDYLNQACVAQSSITIEEVLKTL